MSTAAKSTLVAVFMCPPHFVSKFLLHVSHLHLLSSKATLSIQCGKQNLQLLLQSEVALTTVARRC